jgi:catechol 2,3-dioxygenase-like lactoylglutathione lyase family enzyme
MRLDHVVILVADLDEARADYEALGFHVTVGGRHVGIPTHNALVIFSDGTYLELLAPLDTHSARLSTDPWLLRLEKGEGLLSYALRCAPLPSTTPEAPGLTWEMLEEGRVRPDGVALRWRDLLPSAGKSLTPLPLLIEDITSSELRIPPEEAELHRLPVVGIARLRVVVTDVQKTARQMEQLLGVLPEATGIPGRAHFALRETDPTQVLELVGPDSTPQAADHLARLGEGPCEVELAVASDASGGRILDGPTHGVRFLFGAARASRG